MQPTIWMAWLSDTEGSGGYWTEQAREAQDFRVWSKHAPLHLSFHTTEDGARAALTAACRAEWERTQLQYAHGPWTEAGETDGADHDRRMVAYMGRHVGYEAHVTEQTVHFTPEQGGEELSLVGHHGPARTWRNW